MAHTPAIAGAVASPFAVYNHSAITNTNASYICIAIALALGIAATFTNTIASAVGVSRSSANTGINTGARAICDAILIKMQ